MNALEAYEQLFTDYRIAMNERIARWAAIQRKYRELLHGSEGAAPPTNEDYVAFYAAEEALVEADRDIAAFMMSKFDFEIPPHIRN